MARVYALNAERLVGLLGLVPFARNSRRFLAQPVEVALDECNLPQLAVAAQLPPARLLEMRPDPLEWTLTDTDVCTVCGLCLDEDLCQGRDPYLRAEWRQSWRIFCPIHEVRLLSCRMSAITGTASDASVIHAIDDLYVDCGFVQDNINRALGSNRDFFHLTSAIEEMETVIRRAISGEAPRHAAANLHMTPMPPFERYRLSMSLPCALRRSGGLMYCSPRRTAAAILPKWDFPRGSGICCVFGARSACIGLRNV